ncbi:MAG: hypothetical protein LDL44_18740, partial [Caenispirillum sp.]|nr:hypothetical protein [Caenispirillum sp.]
MTTVEQGEGRGLSRPLLTALLVAVLTALALVGVERMLAASLAAAERAAVVDRASSLRARLETAVNR